MKRLLHILHISSAKSWRGGEQQIAYLASELQRYEIQQIVFCVANKPLHEWCLRENIPHLTYQKRASVDPLLSYRIRQICYQSNITHIHAHDSHAHTYAFVSAYFFGNHTPIVLSRRVDFPISNSFFSRLKYNHSSIRKIVCVSHSIRRVMQPFITDENKLIVIHSGIDLSRFYIPKKNDLRETYNLSDSIRVIMNVAALSVHKDHATFIRTAERLLQNREDLIFVIVGGDAGNEATIRSLIAEKGLSSSVLLTGHRDDVVALLKQADVFLFTSQKEGLGTSVLDAFAAQLPVVTTAAGGIPEMVIPEKTGYLASVGDDEGLAIGVERMLSDETYRLHCIQEAHNLLQQFTHQKMAGATIKLYRTVT